jgi:hypothetical protein
VPRRFPPPWSINEHQELFNVKDAMRSCAAASNRSLQRLSFQCSRAGRLVGMRRKSWIVGALAAALSIGATDTVLAGFAGPGPWITGNDTGGIIPYSPALEGVYEKMALEYCRAGGGYRISPARIASTAITSASSASISRG